jgi:hypothetical protein
LGWGFIGNPLLVWLVGSVPVRICCKSELFGVVGQPLNREGLGIVLLSGLGFACLQVDFEPVAMIIDQALKLIKSCAEQMNARYKRVVFDEWAIISLADRKGRLLAYIGPRKTGFQKNFLDDAGALRAGLLAGQTNIGDFEFARHGVGTGFESFMVLGEGLFLICNNTVQSMDGITENPLWLSAQVPFVELSDKFRADPLVPQA